MSANSLGAPLARVRGPYDRVGDLLPGQGLHRLSAVPSAHRRARTRLLRGPGRGKARAPRVRRRSTPKSGRAAPGPGTGGRCNPVAVAAEMSVLVTSLGL
jgi:hypothetical protein